MITALHQFQENALSALQGQIRAAQDAYRSSQTPQALSLCAVTGSGKTVIAGALIESLHVGLRGDAIAPECAILWLSDSPELNRQAYQSFTKHTSLLYLNLVMIDETSLPHVLKGGTVYFLNTQKLGKNSSLVKAGDAVTSSVWSVIQNTTRSLRENFLVIIDEAHRGSGTDDQSPVTIMQRFVRGHTENGITLDPVPLVLGISATPERFNKLLERSRRVTYPPHEVTPDEVRASGLIKNRVIHWVADDRNDAVGFMEAGVRHWLGVRQTWEAYCRQENAPDVNPLLLIQVENASHGDDGTTTDLEPIFNALRAAHDSGAWKWGDFTVAHVGVTSGIITAHGRTIPSVTASSITNDSRIQVVLFKQALTTGWDCPRAEVLVSYRGSRDATYIGQLIGRMVRSPLGQTIVSEAESPSYDSLNDVSVYLPRFSRSSIQQVVAGLNGDSVGVSEHLVNPTTWSMPAAMVPLAEAYARLTTYRISRSSKRTVTETYIQAAEIFDVHTEGSIPCPRADEGAIITEMDAIIAAYVQEPQFPAERQAIEKVAASGISATGTSDGWRASKTAETSAFTTSPTAIRAEFEAIGRSMAGQERLHMKWFNAKPRTTGDIVDFIATFRNPVQVTKLHAWSMASLTAILNIRAMATQEGRWTEMLDELIGSAVGPIPTTVSALPSSICEQAGDQAWTKHVYQDAAGEYSYVTKKTSWEPRVIASMAQVPGQLGWLRNLPRKPWSLCVPCQTADGHRGVYPDFILFVNGPSGITMQIWDPHTPTIGDAAGNMRGMAVFAAKHGHDFTAIYCIAEVGKALVRINLSDPVVRSAAAAVKNTVDTQALYGAHGETMP